MSDFEIDESVLDEATDPLINDSVERVLEAYHQRTIEVLAHVRAEGYDGVDILRGGDTEYVEPFFHVSVRPWRESPPTYGLNTPEFHRYDFRELSDRQEAQLRSVVDIKTDNECDHDWQSGQMYSDGWVDTCRKCGETREVTQ